MSESVCVRPILSNSWSACPLTLENHGKSVTSVAFSHDSKHLASISFDGIVKIWGAGNGTCVQMLKGYGSGVNLVAFSHDSTHLASASLNWAIKIWDPSRGACLHSLEGHNNAVTSVAFSHVSKQLASASRGRTVKICDVGSGQIVIINKFIFDLVFSHATFFLHRLKDAAVVQNSKLSYFGAIRKPKRSIPVGSGMDLECWQQ